MVEEEIGKRLKQCRKRNGFTQEQLAEKVELSTNYISAVERGIYSLSLDKLVEIINCLGCTADEIFCDVIKTGYIIKTSKINEEIESLPIVERNRILEIIEAVIKTAKN